jgi:hypothetical protein
MDINLGSENNNMNSLSFIWTAKFKNSEDICQFNFETGLENKFQLVKDNFDKLEYFILWNKEKFFTVDLINGIIYFNTELKEKQEFLEKKENIRLIFFRRHQVKISEKDLQEQSHIIEYHLGFQYLDSNNINHKVILQINENGDFVING